MAEDIPSLMSLEEELTCSICLSPFDYPVTIPCGHNFCQDCLLATWQDHNYSCPQCRTHFPIKPELKKNTVLSTVVETFKTKSMGCDLSFGLGGEPLKDDAAMFAAKEPEVAVILCDTCMEAKALKTCLTCMASFCEEHVRPHQENPIFAQHQLTDPLGDLLERICPDHHKLMEFFCVEHGRCICSVCLQQVHKSCRFSTPDEQRAQQESDLRNKVGLLDGKIDKNQSVISQMKGQQAKLKESALTRKRILEADYRQIRELLDRDEREALTTVDREQEGCQTKLQNLMKKFGQNVDKLTSTKDSINALLIQSQSLAFLQTSVDMPSVLAFDPYTPRVTLDSKPVMATQAFTAALREHLAYVLKQPVEARMQILKPERGTDLSGNAPPPLFMPNPHEMGGRPGQQRHPRSPSPGAPLRAGQKKPNIPNPGRGIMGQYSLAQETVEESLKILRSSMQNLYEPDKKSDHKAGKQPKKPPQVPRDPFLGPQIPKEPRGFTGDPRSRENQEQPKKPPQVPRDPREPRGSTGEPRSRENPGTPSVPLNITSTAKRTDLLQYGVVLTLDPKTAHKRISLGENLTKASVSDEAASYPDSPARFTVCSQVMCSKGFSRGRHYWEVKMSTNNFTGIGLAYNSIDRKGPASRLGRNGQSWCVEWFNMKLSAWHASSETVLANPSPSRVGVLLDCQEGTATFYNIVATNAHPFHTFVFPFAETVYPAFWIFSSGSTVSLCKLQQ